MPSSIQSTPPPMQSGRRPMYRSVRPGQSIRPGQSVRPSPPVPAATHTVLVIDDDDMVRRALVRGLRRNHTVVDLRDAESAIQLIESGHRFDAILCDMNLGGMSGRDFVVNLEMVDLDQARRVVILSGDPTSLDPDLFGDITPRFLEKPAAMTEIEAALAELLLIARAA